MNKTALLVDVNDLYHNIKIIYGNAARINYTAYLDYLKDLSTVDTRLAWLVKSKNDKLKTVLKNLDFTINETKVKRYTDLRNNYKGNKIEHAVPMTVQIMTMLDDYQTFIIGSSNQDLRPIIKYLESIGVNVIIYASNIPRCFTTLENNLEIPQSLIQGI